MRHGRRLRRVHPPIEPDELVRESSVAGGIPVEDRILEDWEASTGLVVPTPFDYWAIFPLPGIPSEGNLFAETTSVPRGPEFFRAPRGHRCYLDAFQVYARLNAGGGPVSQAWMDPASEVIWRLLVDGQPFPPYANVKNTWLGPWEYVSPRPLVEIPEGSKFTVSFKVTDPGSIYSDVGVRLRGRFVPWSLEEELRPGRCCPKGLHHRIAGSAGWPPGKQ